MTLTEVVFEVSDANYPVCRFTRENPGIRGVYRVIDAGLTSGLFRATLTLLGPTETTGALLKELRSLNRYDELEVLSMTPSVLLLRLGNKVSGASGIGGIGLRPVERILEIFGTDTLLEPVFIENGTLRVRFLVPRVLDTKQVLGYLQELQATIQWDHFRVIRVSEYKTTRYAESVRRLLGPDQEALIHLAVGLGFYSSPKGCTLDHIAKRVGLSISPVHKKLKAIEQTLINAYVDPASAQAAQPAKRSRRPRAQAEALAASAGGMVEVNVRVEWPGFPPADIAARNPGVRIIHQPLAEDPKEGTASALYVVLASPRQYQEFEATVAHNPSVLKVEAMSKDLTHLSVKVRTRLAPTQGNPLSPPMLDLAPFTRLHALFGRDSYFKPILIDGRDIWIRFVIMRRLSPSEIEARLEDAGRVAGWRAFEVVSLRGVDADPAAGGGPQVEKMTPRQEEILRIAHALGYYKTPRECTLDAIAGTLGISANAIHKNLTAAEEKIIHNYLNAGF